MNTGNLGVSALLASTVKCILQDHPHAKINLLEGDRRAIMETVTLGSGQTVTINSVGIRCNKTIWRQNHLVRIFLSACCANVLPKSWREKWYTRNPYLQAISSAELVMDITGGDSFSDIYGMRRFILGSLRKILVLTARGKLFLLPQTYGPFKSFLSRILARIVIRRAKAVYSRDKQGLEELQKLMGSRGMRAEPQYCPDVALVLDSIAPPQIQITPEPLPAKTIIGLNISGLLYNGGYTENNAFGLQFDYREMVLSLIGNLLSQEEAVVLLVSHVFPKADLAVESDLQACREIYQELHNKYPHRLFLVEGKYDQSEIKHIIGHCQFFMGSRMHACIAALSQKIPVVGIAYSKKFDGVFESIGVKDCVADARNQAPDEIIELIQNKYQQKEKIRRHLNESIPIAQKRIMSIFNEMEHESG